MSVSHVVYGLRLAASELLPGLPLSPEEDGSDVRIRLKESRTFFIQFPESANSLNVSSCDPADSRPNLRVRALPDGSYVGFFYNDGARFAVDEYGREVWADWPENYSLEDACTYLVGPVLGFVLRLRGTVCLHASGVAVDGRAIALVGLPGAGKSTTAAGFACCGFPVLSDDVVALTDLAAQFLVEPGYPRINLWPDSVGRLFQSEDALPRITPTWDKRYMPLGQNGHHFASSPLSLGAIYLLEGRYPALPAPVLDAVSGKEALIALVSNTYVNYLLDQKMRRTEFEVLSRVVSGVPVRRVRSPAEPCTIYKLCEAIADDARRVMPAVQGNANSVLG